VKNADVCYDRRAAAGQIEKDQFSVLFISAPGPTLPTWAVQQVGSYLGVHRM
jgi:hypothetical protein